VAQQDHALDAIKLAHHALVSAYVDAQHRARPHFLASPLVNSHARGGINAVRDLYVQLAETSEDVTSKQWLSNEANALDEFVDTFKEKAHVDRVGWLFATASKVWAFPAVASVAAFTGLAAVTLELLNECLCYLLRFAPMSLAIAFLLIYNYGFWDKRELFLKGGNQNLYAIENRLFDLLGARKTGEAPLDVVGWFAIMMVFLIALVLVGALNESDVIYSPNLMWIYGALTALAALAMLGNVIVWWRRTSTRLV